MLIHEVDCERTPLAKLVAYNLVTLLKFSFTCYKFTASDSLASQHTTKTVQINHFI